MNHHQRPHHHSRHHTPHDSLPQHYPPHDPHYPYHTPYAPSSRSSTPCPHCEAPPTSFHHDTISGDLLCTTCGAVLDDHLRDGSAEWREFGTVEDIARGHVPGARVRGGDVPVDETRWVGGLMPTTVGREYRSSTAAATAAGNMEERHKLAALRQRLKRTHNMIENMLEKEQKERYKEVVLTEQARAAKARRGEQLEDTTASTITSISTFGETSVTVEGDYEGLMAAQRIKEQSQPTATNITSSSSSNPKPNEKYTALNHKWSLPHAIILHGTLQHVQQYASDYSSECSNSADGEWTHSTLEMERKLLLKKLDSSIRLSTYKLYVAFVLLERAANALQFHGMANRTFREAVSWLVKFASVRDDLRISGISSGKKKKGVGGEMCLESNGCQEESLSLSLFSGSDELETLLSSTVVKSSSSKKSSCTVWNELQRMKQYASLGAAILYVSAKRTGVGRTLPEVCAAFGTFDVVTAGRRDDSRAEAEESAAALVRPKYCSRAMEELKQAVPDVIGPVKKEMVVAAQPPSSCVSAPSVKQEVASPPLESISRVTPDYLPSDMSSEMIETDAEEAALADLTSRMASSLNLPPSATVAAVAVATQCKRSVSAPQEARKTPKYIRPRQRRAKSVVKIDSDEIIAAASLLLVSTAGGIMQRLAEQGLSNTQTSSEAQVDTLASWSEWSNQPPWHREVLHLEQCTGLPCKSILACYSNTLHPRRAHLLGVVKRKFELGGLSGEKYLQNIAVAVPLMSLGHKV